MMHINLAAAAIVLVRGLLALNHMCPGTALRVRATWLLLTVGAAAVLLLGAPPTWPEVALHCGIAALVCVDRRAPIICESKP
ncbi:hypothetical protein [Janthinobacterium sp.]|uniref:hypothetical protein n=1 Tax=Janthinobacterium sp. TaxID=1871054 RepID=UPI00293D9DCD|nr:hypothetical protein [Janthinobacterium sp.]